jgi:hypothetical protein
LYQAFLAQGTSAAKTLCLHPRTQVANPALANAAREFFAGAVAQEETRIALRTFLRLFQIIILDFGTFFGLLCFAFPDVFQVLPHHLATSYSSNQTGFQPTP